MRKYCISYKSFCSLLCLVLHTLELRLHGPEIKGNTLHFTFIQYNVWTRWLASSFKCKSETCTIQATLLAIDLLDVTNLWLCPKCIDTRRCLQKIMKALEEMEMRRVPRLDVYPTHAVAIFNPAIVLLRLPQPRPCRY